MKKYTVEVTYNNSFGEQKNTYRDFQTLEAAEFFAGRFRKSGYIAEVVEEV